MKNTLRWLSIPALALVGILLGAMPAVALGLLPAFASMHGSLHVIVGVAATCATAFSLWFTWIVAPRAKLIVGVVLLTLYLAYGGWAYSTHPYLATNDLDLLLAAFVPALLSGTMVFVALRKRDLGRA